MNINEARKYLLQQSTFTSVKLNPETKPYTVQTALGEVVVDVGYYKFGEEFIKSLDKYGNAILSCGLIINSIHLEKNQLYRVVQNVNNR